MTVLRLHCEPVRDDWLDAYGHLNEAYYLVPFSNATWKLQAHFGVGVPYFEKTGGAIYTVESHLRYVDEVRAPATLDIESIVLGVEGKRWRFAHVMKVDGAEKATFECMALHVDSKAGRTTPLPDDVQAALAEAVVDPLPDWAGCGIGLGRK